MLRFLYYLILIVYNFPKIVKSDQPCYYTINAPSTLFPNSEFDVVVTIYKSPEPIPVKVTIGDNSYSDSKEVIVQPKSSELVTFNVPDLPDGSYNLTVESNSIIEFKKIERLFFVSQKQLIFIQTDKTVFKPSDLVQYRIVVLDRYSKPVGDDTKINVSIKDSRGNLIQKKNAVTLTKGVYSNELKLSSQPVLGEWRILVDVDQQVDTAIVKKIFTVNEYELPTFEVEIYTAKNVFYGDKKIHATVRAKYTFGKPVKGVTTLVLYPQGYNSPLFEEKLDTDCKCPHNYPYPMPIHPSFSTPTARQRHQINSQDLSYSQGAQTYPSYQRYSPQHSRMGLTTPPMATGYEWDSRGSYPNQGYYLKRTVPIDGKAKVEFDLDGLPMNFMPPSYNSPNFENIKYFVLEAVVEDELTAKKYNASTIVKVHNVKHYLKLDKGPPSFEPNIPFKVSAKLEDLSGKPIEDLDHPIKFMLTRIINYNNPEEEPLSMANQTFFNKYGLASMTYILPESNNSIIYQYQITAKYLNTAILLHKFVQSHEHEGKLYLDVETEDLFVGKEVELEVRSPKDLEYFVYYVISKGNILEAQFVEVPNKKHFIFKFTGSQAMVPKAKVAIHTIIDGRIYEAGTTIRFPEEPLNYIKINVPSQVEPAEAVDIIVNTNPNSYIAIMGIDQSVLLSQESGSLTNGNFFDAMEQYYNFARGGSIITIANAIQIYEPESVRGDSGGEPVHSYSMPALHYGPFGRVDQFLDDIGQLRASSRKADMLMQIEDYDYYNEFTSGPAFWEPRIREEFPEIWLWESYETSGISGEVKFRKEVPDTITSWVVTGFSIDPVTGFAASKNPRTIRVFQPFFVTATLPYSIKRGELLAIPVSVYNYLEDDLETDIILDDSDDEFEFVGSDNLNSSEKKITIPANSGKSVTFVIKPTKVGRIIIKITATSPLAGDAIENILLVKPEGFTEYATKSVLFDLRNEIEQTTEITIELPQNVVPDSAYIEATVTADLLGITIPNLQNLIRQPIGSGEQTMITFLPNIYIYRYLEVTNQLTDELKAKIFGYLEQGYQRQLSYKRDDGSFSAFGKSDSDGSVWLTAYVAQAIQEASNFIEIDGNVLNFAVRFLLSHQQENGGFTEAGVVIDKAHSSNEGIPLTAFVTLALIENVDKYPESDLVKASIDKALSYIVNKVTVADDIYSIAISAYVLQKTDHASKTQFMEMLEQRAKVKDDQKSWSSGDNSLNKYIEVNAYAALAYLEAEMISESLPVFKYLISNMNGFGGFQSTKDTVIGLKALSRFAETFPSVETDIKFVFRLPLDDDIELQVKADTALVLHSAELPSLLHTFKVIATGHGIALGQVTYKYNVDEFDEGDRFLLKPAVAETSTKTHLKLSACTSYVAKPGESAESNMAIMEVGLPSGYMFDKEKLNSLKGSYNIKRVETRDADTLAVLYFDFLNDNEVCPTFEAFRTHKVADEKPASVIVYDYYDNTRQTKKMYTPNGSSVCEICGGDCSAICPAN